MLSASVLKITFSFRLGGTVQEPRRTRHQVQLCVQRDTGSPKKQHFCEYADRCWNQAKYLNISVSKWPPKCILMHVTVM